MISPTSRPAVAATLAVLLLSQAFAQTTNQPQPPAPQDPVSVLPKDKDVMQLDPFSLVDTGDKGYQAQNTLSGTRLKTSMLDVASPISTFTEQFFRDTAITDTSDLAGFMLSTEYDVGENDGSQNNPLKGTTRPLRMRGIGAANGDAAPTVNFFKFDGRMDTFNIERLDQSRGPNSILFGIASPAGVMNVTTKRAILNKDSGEVDVAGKSEGGLREVVDYNQVILKDKLAIRVAAVQDGQNSWRNYEYNDNERYFGTVKWKIDDKTELNVEGEHGHTDKATKRLFTAYDNYTPWVAAGKPISSKPGPGVVALSNTPYMVYDTATGQLMNWQGQTTSSSGKEADGSSTVLTDFNVLPKETSIYGPGYHQLDDYTRLTAILSHEFSPNLHAECAAFRYDNLSNDIDTQDKTSLALQVDTNALLPNGLPNPNAGKPYLEGLPQINMLDTRDDAVRGSLAYDFDLGSIFGKHTLVGVYQYSHENYAQYVLREQILVNAPNKNTPENNANRVWRRTYVNLDGPSSDIVMSNWTLEPTVSGLKDLVSGNTVQSAFIPFNANTQINSNRMDSFIGALQSAFWDGRVHTVVGVSHDERIDYYGTQVRSNLAGFTGGGILTPIPGTVQFENQANNVTFNGVVRTFDWLYLTYSQAANAALPDTTGRLHSATGHPPTPHGTDQDIGIKLDFFNHRLFITASHFDTEAKKDFDTTGVNGTTINPIWNTLNDAGVLAQKGLTIDQVTDNTTGSTRDTVSKGYEVELMGNPMPNLRIYANYTYNRTVVTNFGQEMIDYVATNLPLWNQYAALPLSSPTASAKTIGDQIGVINTAMFNQFTVQDGQEPLGQRRHKVNLRTNYDFTDDVFKGFSIGGGARYMSANTIQFIVATDANNNILSRTPIYGSPQFFMDGNIGYAQKLHLFGQSIHWSIQLNINNLLNNNAFVRLRNNPQGQLVSYMFNAPRQWVLTNRFEF